MREDEEGISDVAMGMEPASRVNGRARLQNGAEPEPLAGSHVPVIRIPGEEEEPENLVQEITAEIFPNAVKRQEPASQTG